MPDYVAFRFYHFLPIVLIFLCIISCNDDDAPPIAEIAAVTPSSALPNTVVAITGKNFSTVFNENKVSFNGKDALVLNASSTQLNVVVPQDVHTGPILLSINGKQAKNQPLFTALLLPSVITSIFPLSGGYNATVTIAGANFLDNPVNNTVTFNGVPAVVETSTATSLTVKVPIRAGTGAVIVNGVAAVQKFTYLPDVFIVGYMYDKDGFARATYWKNGIPTTLGPAGQHSFAYDLAVSGDDVYVTGSKGPLSSSLARYWKNGIEIPLTEDKFTSSAQAITIVGSDIYIAGYENISPSKSLAKCWKNGTPLTVTHGAAATTYATGIAVNGQEVYLSGNSQDAGGNSFATYWKNGTPYQLSSSVSYAWNILISGSDIYLTGSERNTAPGIGFVTYWKNESISRISPGITGANGRDMAVSGKDVYVAGIENNAKYFGVAKYWKNGFPVSLSDGSHSTYANSIDVIGEDVYVAGWEDKGLSSGVKLWKNGVAFSITDGGYTAIAEGLVLR